VAEGFLGFFVSALVEGNTSNTSCFRSYIRNGKQPNDVVTTSTCDSQHKGESYRGQLSHFASFFRQQHLQGSVRAQQIECLGAMQQHRRCQLVLGLLLFTLDT
jgi:hypothetical protein